MNNICFDIIRSQQSQFNVSIETENRLFINQLIIMLGKPILNFQIFQEFIDLRRVLINF